MYVQKERMIKYLYFFRSLTLKNSKQKHCRLEKNFFS